MVFLRRFGVGLRRIGRAAFSASLPCLLVLLHLQDRAGSRPGVPSYFLLLAQKKVTKEKSLKHI